MATSGASDVLPARSIDDFVDRRGCDAVVTGDADVAFSGCGTRPDVDDVSLAKDGRGFVLSRFRRLPSRMEVQSRGRSVIFIKPSLVSDDAADVCLGRAKLCGKYVLSYAVGEQAAYLSDGWPSQAGARVVFSGERSALTTAAQHPVSRIVVVCAGHEMVRINASGAVASVSNQQALWHRPLEGFVALKVRSQRSLLVGQLPVSECVGPGGPVQTTIRPRRAIVRKNALDPAPSGSRAVRLKLRSAKRAKSRWQVNFRREHTNVCAVSREVLQ